MRQQEINEIKNETKRNKNFCHCKSKSNLKQYFNNKSLILFVNHVLLGFYLCQSRIHKYYRFSCTHST